MTLQEIFDKSVTGIKKQGRLSQGPVNPGNGKPGVCYYRHPDDPAVRCAVGHLIPDEMYDGKKMEGRSVNSDAVLGAPLREHLGIPRDSAGHPSPPVSMLSQLQTAHDNAPTVEKFLISAADVARQFHLSSAVCDVDVPDEFAEVKP